MSLHVLPSRSGRRPNGTEAGAAVSNESVSPTPQYPSSTRTELPPERIGDLADAPITLSMSDLAAPYGQLAGRGSPQTADQEYGAPLWRRWQADVRAPIETLLESVVQHVSGALVVLDADLRVRLANRAFCRSFQVAPSKIVGRWFPELGVGDRSGAQLRALLDQILAPDGQLERVSIGRDDLMTGRRSLVIQGRELVEPGTGDRLILLEIEDVTEDETTERHRREHLVTVVHEMRNSLAAIKGYAQMMEQRKATREKALPTILNQVRQLSRLGDDLLASSGAEIAALLLQPSLMDLVTLTRASAEQTQLLSPGHRICLEAGQEPIDGLWDSGRLTQVFANLLGNAVKYSPAGGEIVVRVQELGPRVRVSIEDHGTGIAADALPRIFDQFYRVAATADHVPGLGLGLHVSKMLVEAHGGSISVQSMLGEGSTLTVELPRGAPVLSLRSGRQVETAR